METELHFVTTLLRFAEVIKNKELEAFAQTAFGALFYSIGQNDKAIKHTEIGLTIAKEIRSKECEELAYGILGICYKSLGHYETKAIEHLGKYLAITKEIGDKEGEALAYCNLGSCYISIGQYDKASKYLEMQLIMAKELGNKESEMNAYGQLGVCYQYLGHYDMGIKHTERSLTIAKDIGDKKGKGRAYGNLGTCYVRLCQYDKAIKLLEMHLTIAKETGEKKVEGTAYGNLGACHVCLGQYDKAIKLFEMHLTIARETGEKKGEGSACGNLGYCYKQLGQYDKAVNHIELNITIANEIGDKVGKSRAYGNLGACYISVGQYEKAIKYLEKSLTVAKQIGDKEGESRAYGNLGNCYFFLGQKGKAIKHTEISLTIAKRIGSKQCEGEAFGNLGDTYLSFGQYVKAEANLRKGVECYGKLFENVPKWDEYKVSVIDTFIHIYKLLIKTLLAQDKRYKALIVAEKGRSRALVDLMLTTDPVGYTVVTTTAGLVSNYQEILNVAKALGSTVIFFTLLIPDICTWIIQPNGDMIFQNRSTEASQESENNCIKTYSDKDLNSLINQTTKLMTPCRAVDSCEDRSLSFLYPKEYLPKPAEKPPESILACAATLDILPGALQPGVLAPHPAPMQENEAARTTALVGPKRTEVSIDLTQQEQMLKCLLRDLYQILLKPVRQYVVGSQAIIVPEGRLALVPFAALMDENGHYVSDSLHVRLIPSLTTAKMIREHSRQLKGQTEPLIIGDPDVGEVVMDDKVFLVKRLPFARTEIEMVGQFLRVEPLMDDKATKENFLQKVENANVIHIAAHGHAARGEILLARCSGTNRNNVEDIMLTINDLERKRLKASLVVLSCCHSGCGEVRAEGVVGIARAFLGAGARAVVVTLWAVDDGATLCFMYRFYEHLTRGKSANEALNEAMQATREIEMFRHPRYWAPFVLIGEDVAPFDVQ